jgi:hypothetical protein
VCVQHQPIPRANPERPLTILDKAGDSLTSESRSVRQIEYRESDAVKSCQPRIRVNPKITVAGLLDGRDGILWQATVGLPVLVNVLCQL